MKPTSAFAFLNVRTQRKLFVLLAGAALAILVGQSQTVDASQTAFTYQGQLKDSGVRANGTYELQFTLFTAQTGGDQSSSIVGDSILVTDGSFAVGLNFGNTFFDGTESWLEIAVRPAGSSDPFTVLSPRQRLTPTPYAILAQAEPWSLIGVPVGFVGGVNNDVVTLDKSLTIAAKAKGDGGWTDDKGVLRLTTDSDKVGIGTKKPIAKLDVVGDIHASDAVTVGNSVGMLSSSLLNII